MNKSLSYLWLRLCCPPGVMWGDNSQVSRGLGAFFGVMRMSPMRLECSFLCAWRPRSMRIKALFYAHGRKRMAPGPCAWRLGYAHGCVLRGAVVPCVRTGMLTLPYVRAALSLAYVLPFLPLVSSREWLFLVDATEWAGEGGREHSWGLYNARRPAAAGCMVRWAQASGFPDGRGRGRCSFAPSSVRPRGLSGRGWPFLSVSRP